MDGNPKSPCHDMRGRITQHQRDLYSRDLNPVCTCTVCMCVISSCCNRIQLFEALLALAEKLERVWTERPPRGHPQYPKPCDIEACVFQCSSKCIQGIGSHCICCASPISPSCRTKSQAESLISRLQTKVLRGVRHTYKPSTIPIPSARARLLIHQELEGHPVDSRY